MSSKATDTQSEIQQTQPSRRGVLYVVSSPSGGGKGTLIRRVLDVVPNLSYSVSYTTRAPRNGEVNGREYFFVDRKLFEEMVAAGDFLEWAIVHGNLYGTSQKQVASETSSGADIVLEVDVQGAANALALYPQAITVFVLPPSYAALVDRLRGRGANATSDLRLRLLNGRSEIEQFRHFDYLVINDDLGRATEELTAIIVAARCRRERRAAVAENILTTFMG